MVNCLREESVIPEYMTLRMSPHLLQSRPCSKYITSILHINWGKINKCLFFFKKLCKYITAMSFFYLIFSIIYFQKYFHIWNSFHLLPNCWKSNILSISQEQIEWAVEYGVDYIIAETFNDLGEAMLALKAIQQYGKGIVKTVNMYELNVLLMYNKIIVIFNFHWI